MCKGKERMNCPRRKTKKRETEVGKWLVTWKRYPRVVGQIIYSLAPEQYHAAWSLEPCSLDVSAYYYQSLGLADPRGLELAKQPSQQQMGRSGAAFDVDSLES